MSKLGRMLADARFDRDHGAPRRVFNDVLREFTRTIPPDARALEVGAGVYDYASYFPVRLETFNIDPETRPDILGDAHDMPIEDGVYDVCLCNSTLEHVRNPYQVAREIHRILKPGGRVFAWLPFYFGVHSFPIDVSRFTREGCVVLFEEAGFTDVVADAEPWSGLFQNLHNTVHFVLPRTAANPRVRRANRALLALTRLGFPLDKRYKLRTLYAGCSVVATKDA